MNIFQYINSLLFSKKKIDMNCDDESQFNLYMVNRWGSMYSPEIANYINETSNKYWSLFNDKISQYEYIYNILPRLKYKRLSYIKKIKKEKKKKEDEPIIPEFSSKREYKMYVDLETTVNK
mgnify:FL=1